MVISSELSSNIPTKPFHETLLEQCSKFCREEPGKAAFLLSEQDCEPISYSQLIDRTRSVAAWLQKNGYKKGDIILLCLHNSWQFVVSCLGAWMAGLTVSAASPQFSHFEVCHQFQDSTAVSVITDDQCLPTVRKATDGLPVRHVINVGRDRSKGTVFFSDLLLSSANSFYPVEIDMENDLIILPYSSGTTGTPKGVMITHLNYAHMLESYLTKYDAEYRARGMDGFVPPPVTLTFLPLYHAMGLFGMLFNLFNGTTQILMKGYKEAKLLQHIQDYELMAVSLVPSIVVSLASSPLLDRYDLSSWMIVLCGSAPLSQSAVDRLKKRLPDLTFAQGYGMTETSVASHIGSADAPPGSIGKLVPGTQMKVISDDGRECGPHQEGEMWLKGPQIMKGYWRRPEQTRESFDAHGYMRTGDIVYYNEAGFTFVTDRIKELIKVHAKQVAPAELEDIILELPSVADCCVVGVPHEKAGEVPLAFVVGNNVEEHHIHTHVNGRVASYKRLTGGVQFVASLPRTPTGKLLRRKLKQDYLKNNKSKM